MCAQGVVYYREKLGALLLKKPQEGWQALFKQEGLDEVLALAGDRDFRMVLAEISRSHHTSFKKSLPSQNLFRIFAEQVQHFIFHWGKHKGFPVQ